MWSLSHGSERIITLPPRITRWTKNNTNGLESGMPHLTKAEIERSLLQGTTVGWQDAKGKKVQLFLGDSKERRLFAFILSSKTRVSTGLTESFIAGLQAAYDASDDPAKSVSPKAPSASTSDSWRLDSI